MGRCNKTQTPREINRERARTRKKTIATHEHRPSPSLPFRSQGLKTRRPMDPPAPGGYQVAVAVRRRRRPEEERSCWVIDNIRDRPRLRQANRLPLSERANRHAVTLEMHGCRGKRERDREREKKRRYAPCVRCPRGAASSSGARPR